MFVAWRILLPSVSSSWRASSKASTTFPSRASCPARGCTRSLVTCHVFTLKTARYYRANITAFQHSVTFTVWTNSKVTVLLCHLQIPCIESLLRDRTDHVDWRRLLLSAALPWPSPSMKQLLAALEGFKAVDSDLTGYVTEEEYLQVCPAPPPSLTSFKKKNSSLFSSRMDGLPPSAGGCVVQQQRCGRQARFLRNATESTTC